MKTSEYGISKFAFKCDAATVPPEWWVLHPRGPTSPAIIEDERFELFTFTTGDVPGTAVTGELVFTFNPRATNSCRVRIDMAEVRCLSL